MHGLKNLFLMCRKTFMGNALSLNDRNVRSKRKQVKKFN